MQPFLQLALQSLKKQNNFKVGGSLSTEYFIFVNLENKLEDKFTVQESECLHKIKQLTYIISKLCEIRIHTRSKRCEAKGMLSRFKFDETRKDRTGSHI